MPVSIVLADSHPVVRAGLRSWFSGTEIKVVGEAAHGNEAFDLVERLAPAVLLTEVLLPRGDGLALLAQLNQTEIPTKTLFYTGQTNPTYTARAMALGALGLVSKGIATEVLIKAILDATQDAPTWDEQSLRRHTGTLDLAANVLQDPPALTTRESQVLKQLAFGLSNKEIAQALDISYETVKEHVQHVLRKLSVADRTQAAVWAVRNGQG